MSNHIHLLVTPTDKSDLATFMQSMANRYVRYYNAEYHQTGTIWEGRYKSCLVDSDNYLFTLYKYIEMNPVKAKMVSHVADYRWSSYRHNALGDADNLISEHSLYRALADSREQCHDSYRQLFDALDISLQSKKISQATLAGDVYGSNKFHSKVAQLLSRSTKSASHGGDRKSDEYRNQVG